MRRVPCLQGILNDTTTSPFSSYTAKQSDIAFPVSLWYDFYLNTTPPLFLSSFFFQAGPITLCLTLSLWRKRRRNMHSRKSLQVGLLRKLMVLAFLSLLVCGEKEAATVNVGIKNHSTNMHQRQKHQRLRHSFDVFFSNKRKVPNASDPLHNRWG